jgi:negative regulator of flagellin synthesis FlgM
MHVSGPAHLHGPQRIATPHISRADQPAARPSSSPIQDELQLSAAAQLMEQSRDVPDIRHDRVASIRAEIANGTYETPEKLDMALSRLLDEIG